MYRHLASALLALLGMTFCSVSAWAQFGPAIGPPAGYVPTAPMPNAMTTPPPPPGWLGAPIAAPTASANFTGDWKSGVGQFHFFRKLSLIQRGNFVTGSYSYDVSGKTYAGTIWQGVVKGDTLKFRWTEGQATGGGTFVMAANGKGFRGNYTVQSNSYSNNWDGWH